MSAAFFLSGGLGIKKNDNTSAVGVCFNRLILRALRKVLVCLVLTEFRLFIKCFIIRDFSVLVDAESVRLFRGEN